jgi:hypothetical protein
MPRKQNTEKEFAVSAGAGAAAVRKPAANSRKKRVTSTASAEPVASLAVSTDTAATAVAEVAEVRSTPVAAELLNAASTEPTSEQVAERAYLIWESRGCQGGSPQDDWFAALQQLRAGK